MKCDCCTINEAIVKDYREDERSGTGNLDKYYVCGNCLHLNNHWFYKLMETPTLLGKKRVMSKIVEGSWKEYIIND